MARVDLDPEDRDNEPLQVSGWTDCPGCGLTQEVVFTADEGVYEVEDLTEAPEQDVDCPECGWQWRAEWQGWLSHGEAG